MPQASGNQMSLKYVAEVTRGTTPATPTMKTLRCTSRNINLTKNILKSAEVRTDRNSVAPRHGFQKVDGSIGAELSLSAYDDWFAGLLGGTWTAGTQVTGETLASAVTANTYTRGTGNFTTDGYKVGDIIIVAGFTAPANNGLKRVIAVGTTTITVAETLSNESLASGGTINLQGKKLKVGTTLTTFSIERAFADIAQFQMLKGCAITACELTVAPEAIVGCNFTLIGMSAAAFAGATGATSTTAAPTNAPMSAFNGSIFEGLATIATVTGARVSISSPRNVAAVVGTTTSPDVFDASISVSGELTVMFENATLYNKFVNETGSSLWLRLNDLNGTDFINIVIPAISYTGGTINPPQEGPVLVSMPFEAGYDATAATTISIQRSNA